MEIYSDIGYGSNLINRKALLKYYSEVEIKYRATLLIIKGINNGRYITTEYIILLMLFKGRFEEEGRFRNETVFTGFIREVTVINDFKANLLLDINYFTPERFNIYLLKGFASIKLY